MPKSQKKTEAQDGEGLTINWKAAGFDEDAISAGGDPAKHTAEGKGEIWLGEKVMAKYLVWLEEGEPQLYYMIPVIGTDGVMFTVRLPRLPMKVMVLANPDPSPYGVVVDPNCPPNTIYAIPDAEFYEGTATPIPTASEVVNEFPPNPLSQVLNSEIAELKVQMASTGLKLKSKHMLKYKDGTHVWHQGPIEKCKHLGCQPGIQLHTKWQDPETDCDADD